MLTVSGAGLQELNGIYCRSIEEVRCRVPVFVHNAGQSKIFKYRNDTQHTINWYMARCRTDDRGQRLRDCIYRVTDSRANSSLPPTDGWRLCPDARLRPHLREATKDKESIRKNPPHVYIDQDTQGWNRTASIIYNVIIPYFDNSLIPPLVRLIADFAASTYYRTQEVEAFYNKTRLWYPAMIHTVSGEENTYDILWCDGYKSRTLVTTELRLPKNGIQSTENVEPGPKEDARAFLKARMMQCKARIFCESGDYNEAEVIFKQLLEVRPHDAQAISHYAKMLNMLLRFEEARKLLTRWRQHDDSRIAIQMKKRKKRRPKSSASDKKRWARDAADRHRYDIVTRLTEVLKDMGDYENLEALHRESIEHSPRIPKAQNLRRLAMFKIQIQNQLPEGLYWLEQCRNWLWNHPSAPSAKSRCLCTLACYRHMLAEDKTKDLGWVIDNYICATTYDDCCAAHGNLALTARLHGFPDIAKYHDHEAERVMTAYRPVDTTKPLYYVASAVALRESPSWLDFYMKDPKAKNLPFGLIFNAEEAGVSEWLKLPSGLYIPMKRRVTDLVKRLPEWSLHLPRDGNNGVDNLTQLVDHYAQIRSDLLLEETKERRGGSGD